MEKGGKKKKRGNLIGVMGRRKTMMGELQNVTETARGANDHRAGFQTQ